MSNPLFGSVSGSLADIKSRIREVGVGGVVGDTLMQNQAELENWYQKLLANKGILTDEERQRLTDSLTSAKKAMLAADARRDKKRIIIVAGISVTVIAGIIFYFYKKRNR